MGEEPAKSRHVISAQRQSSASNSCTKMYGTYLSLVRIEKTYLVNEKTRQIEQRCNGTYSRHVTEIRSSHSRRDIKRPAVRAPLILAVRARPNPGQPLALIVDLTFRITTCRSLLAIAFRT